MPIATLPVTFDQGWCGDGSASEGKNGELLEHHLDLSCWWEGGPVKQVELLDIMKLEQVELIYSGSCSK